jgi:hypothetical protein
MPSAMNRACPRHTHHRLGLAGSPRDLGRAAAIGRRQDDFGAPNMLLRRVVIADNKLTAIGVTFTTIPALMTRA